MNIQAYASARAQNITNANLFSSMVLLLSPDLCALYLWLALEIFLFLLGLMSLTQEFVHII